jgi:hypothetical protein
MLSQTLKTHPDSGWVSLSAHSAFAVCANGKLGKNSANNLNTAKVTYIYI